MSRLMKNCAFSFKKAAFVSKMNDISTYNILQPVPKTSNSYTEINQDEELPSWGRAEGWKWAIRAASASASLPDCASTV